MRLYWLIHFASVAVVIATALPLWRRESWWVRGWDFPRLQLACLAAILLVLQGLLLDEGATLTPVLQGLTALCLCFQLWWIFPYTRLARREVKDTRSEQIDPQSSISILTANVLTPNRQAPRFLELVRQWSPDIVVTLESDSWWQEQLDVLESEYAYTVKCPLDNLYGMHVYSRLPLHDAQVDFLVENDVPSMHAMVELPSGDYVRCHFLHPAPPSPTENEESAERDAELVMVAKSLENYRKPVLVTGDLNDVAWSSTTRLFRKISGLLDPRVGRGMFNTYHAGLPFARWPLDHLFHSAHFTVNELRRLPSFGSDHFALYARLQLSPKPLNEQEGLDADADDEAWAEEKLSQQNVDESDVPVPRV
ncbi:endonuclease/exonuclease/phosphatase (EEP) superfamily protein YafD [Litorivivens lipolytica]|uniref:Endonuclease/exonuclease/phosphatase (EEP) superfamily protein YafD n=1 Tax=Litorivivens lipolytica TaxID=1524264 RepID=A0A7W4Z5M7_9GAMM|nr:endonuclease/exonuclease/phosphatase family protein [Litorivivens lipolytica]MBB3047659.1 endonuclease/exonuclease/phosphatase (EEP) superfamily protein YafD [Litorivivens lipolytica]